MNTSEPQQQAPQRRRISSSAAASDAPGRPRRRGGRGKDASGDASRGKKPGVWRRIFNAIWLAVNILAAMTLTGCAIAGSLDPAEHPYAVLPAMAFTVALAGTILLFVLDLIWWRRTAMTVGLALLMCSGAASDAFPLNFPKRALTPAQEEKSLKLMTYNVMAFLQQNGRDNDLNPQISYILREDPDVVCVQEYMLMMRNRRTGVTQAQVDSLRRRYPYMMTNTYLQAIFSKYPVEPIPIDFQNFEGKGDMAGWRLDVNGRVVNVFSLHLRSLYFTTHDKAAYRKIFHPDDLNRQNLREVKSGILRKIVTASRARALQVDSLKRYIKKYGGRNTIVCGDFNEPEACWGVRTLEKDCGLRQAYRATGFGPMITYNANRFWVRIDHVLYRGDLRPHSMKRGDLRASDHYPLTTVFTFADEAGKTDGESGSERGAEHGTERGPGERP